MECGRLYPHHADNYDRLINAVTEFDEAVFVTLNYDTLLDQRLSIYRALDSRHAYLALRPDPWSLVKLHGSVD